MKGHATTEGISKNERSLQHNAQRHMIHHELVILLDSTGLVQMIDTNQLRHYYQSQGTMHDVLRTDRQLSLS